MPDITMDARVRGSIIDAHLRKLCSPIYTRDPIFAMMKERGRTVFNAKKKIETIGQTFRWRVRYKRRELQSGDATSPSYKFKRVNTKRWAYLGWRHMWLTEASNLLEKLLSQNTTTAIGNIPEEAVKEAAEDFIRGFPSTFYNDGNASGDTDPHGIESFMGCTAPLSTGWVGSPNDTYAQLVTNLAYYGGAWNGGWPLATSSSPAVCSPTYHFWAPLQVDTSDTLWATGAGGGTSSWANDCQQQMDFANTYMQNIQDTDIDLILLNSTMRSQVKLALQDVQTFEVTQNSDLTRLGFKTLQYDGIELMGGHGLPADTGYGLSFDHMELLSLQNDLFQKYTDFDIDHTADKTLFCFFGNWKFESPAYFVKFYPYT